MTSRRALAGLALGVGACGEPLVTGGELDTPVFSLSGPLMSDAPLSADTPLAVGVLWVDPAQQDDGSAVSDQELVAGEIEADGRYTLALYGPPPEAAIRAFEPQVEGGADFAFAWGEIVLFEDRDHDGTFQVGPIAERSPMKAPDVYRGVASTHVLLYVAKPLPWEQTALPDLLLLEVPGYRIGRVDCSKQWVREAAPPTELVVLPPSVTFPALRPCLDSHPALSAP